jgi:hypothetical protein
MTALFQLGPALDHLLHGDSIEIDELAIYLGSWKWGRGPSRRVLDILFDRYSDESTVKLLVEEIITLDTLDKVEAWGSREEMKLNSWDLQFQHYYDSIEVPDLELLPQILPLWIGDAKAESTRGKLFAKGSKWL